MRKLILSIILHLIYIGVQAQSTTVESIYNYRYEPTQDVDGAYITWVYRIDIKDSQVRFIYEESIKTNKKPLYHIGSNDNTFPLDLIKATLNVFYGENNFILSY